MMLPSSAHAEISALPKVDNTCTTPSLIPTGTGNTGSQLLYARTTVRSERKLDHCLTL
jgi:hypothetical protein